VSSLKAGIQALSMKASGALKEIAKAGSNFVLDFKASFLK